MQTRLAESCGTIHSSLSHQTVKIQQEEPDCPLLQSIAIETIFPKRLEVSRNDKKYMTFALFLFKNYWNYPQPHIMEHSAIPKSSGRKTIRLVVVYFWLLPTANCSCQVLMADTYVRLTK